MTLEEIAEATRAVGLDVLGACPTQEDDGLDGGTIVLLGPAEPGFWHLINQSAEFSDGERDPLDRWSKRVVEELADQLNAHAMFPFGAPPRPFIGWALRSGRAWVSPAGMLVHDVAGLLVSYRGALLLEEALMLPGVGESPCATCEQKPCLTTCPVDALSHQGYDLDACHAFLDSSEGSDCLSAGCKVRRACPVSQSYPRHPAQSAFHMAAFHPKA